MDKDNIENNKKIKNRDLRKKLLIYIIIYSIIFIIGIALSMFAQYELSLLSFNVATYIISIGIMATSWFMFLYNKNFFSPLSYGFKSLASRFSKDTPGSNKKDYYEYINDKTPISKNTILINLCVGTALLIISILVHVIFLI